MQDHCKVAGYRTHVIESERAGGVLSERLETERSDPTESRL